MTYGCGADNSRAVSGNCLVIQLISRARDRLARALTVSIVTHSTATVASRGIL
jgi:hypothetical protein